MQKTYYRKYSAMPHYKIHPAVIVLARMLFVIILSLPGAGAFAMHPSSPNTAFHEILQKDTVISPSTSVVRANFKVNSPEGGERAHIVVDGKTLRHRSDIPLTRGLHQIEITRVGYALEYVEVNGEYTPINGNHVTIDVDTSVERVRIVFYMYKK